MTGLGGLDVQPGQAPARPLTIEVAGACFGPFDGSRIVTIGRDPYSTIPLGDERVSWQHAIVYLDGADWVLEDARSTNGCYVAGRRIDRVRLRDVADIRVADPVTGICVRVAGAGGHCPPSQDGPAGRGAAPVGPDGLLRVGRADDNDIVVADLSVSRHHAEVRRAPDGGLTITDLDSHNGTFVNGQPVTSCPLGEGDLVTVGRLVLRFADGALTTRGDTGRAAFQARHLTVRTAAGTTLLDDVSLALEDCSLLAVVGPSGAGKSTLLNAMTGFRPADLGTVRYAGFDLYESYESLRRQIGYVPQDDILHKQLPVRRALRYAAELRFPPDVSGAERDRRVDEVLAELGLSARADLPIHRLSGGQRKRASIGLEGLTRPSLLFLDEPTSGLDPGYEKAVMRLLRDLADGGRTVIVVTHSVQSLDLCDRVLFLAHGGRTAFFGPPSEALAYFGRSEFADVFVDLDQDERRDWTGDFTRHPAAQRYVRDDLDASEPAPSAPAAGEERNPAAVPAGSIRQFSTLLRRYVAVLASDRRNLALLTLQAPILGLLLVLTIPHGLLDPARTNEGPRTLLLILVLAATWVGGMNAVREIVKEFPIYRRERAVGLSIGAYVGSKVVVLSVLTLLQAAVLVLLAVQTQGGPQVGTTLPWPRVELLAGVAGAGLASMALCLLVSAVVSNADKALTLLPLLLIPQLVLSGALFALSDKPGLREVSYAASAQWGFAAVASSVDLVGSDEERAGPCDPDAPPAPESPESPAAEPDPAAGSDPAAPAATAPPPDPAAGDPAAGDPAAGDPAVSTPAQPPAAPCPDPPPRQWAHTSAAWLGNMSLLAALYVLFLLGAGFMLRRRDSTLLTGRHAKRPRG